MAGRFWDLMETQGVYKSDQAEPKVARGISNLGQGPAAQKSANQQESRKPTRDWSKVGRDHLFFIHYFILFHFIFPLFFLTRMASFPAGGFYYPILLLTGAL